MAKRRPFVVSPDEQPVIIPEPFALELELDTPRLLRKFASKYGERFPRLLAALRAAEENENEQT